MSKKRVLVLGLESGVNANVCNVLQENSFDPCGFVFKKDDVEGELKRMQQIVSQNKFDGAVIGHGVQRLPEILEQVKNTITTTDNNVKLILVSGPVAVLSETQNAFAC